MTARAEPVFLVRKLFGLVPSMRRDAELLERYPIGREVKAAITMPRSLPRHRLYWAMLSRVVDATDAFPTAEHLHEALKMALGYVRLAYDLDGKARVVADSTAFHAMDEAEFQAYFEKAMALLAERFGVSVDDLLREAA